LIEQLKKWDTQLFLQLNQYHTSWMDTVMYWVTDTYFWYPMYAVIIFFVVRTYRMEGVWMVLAAILAVGLADLVASGVFKPYFGRLRPCHTVEIQKNVYVLRGCGGQFGFVSAHAATTFALASSLFTLTRERMSYLIWLFPWAALVSYSRIYVGVHYPLDILSGAVVGMLCSVLVLLLYRTVRRSSLLRSS
jgi:undecaprenyl-diphosphatase